MKILFLYDGRRTGAARRVTTDLIFRLQDTEHKFYVYGMGEQELNAYDIAPMRFQPDISLTEVISEIDVDIVLLPNNSVARNLKIKDIGARLSIPKVILENDYYAVIDKCFYTDYNIDLIINQGADRITDLDVDSVWLPFSVPESDTVDTIDNDRINKIVFVGGGRYSLNGLYFTRQVAIRALERADLLDYIGEVGYESYPIILKEYISGLSDSFPPMFMAPLKTFELMSYGTAVLTTKIDTKETLFGTKQCFFEYSLDDLYTVVENIKNDIDKSYEVRKNALSIIKSRHLHKHRIKELISILEAVLSGTEIPKKWGF